MTFWFIVRLIVIFIHTFFPHFLQISPLVSISPSFATSLNSNYCLLGRWRKSLLRDWYSHCDEIVIKDSEMNIVFKFKHLTLPVCHKYYTNLAIKISMKKLMFSWINFDTLHNDQLIVCTCWRNPIKWTNMIKPSNLFKLNSL